MFAFAESIRVRVDCGSRSCDYSGVVHSADTATVPAWVRITKDTGHQVTIFLGPGVTIEHGHIAHPAE